MRRRRESLTLRCSLSPPRVEANSTRESIPEQKVRSEVKRVGGGEDTRKTALAGLRWGCVQDKERAGSRSRLLSWLTRIVRQHCSPLFDYRAFVYTIQPRGFLLSNPVPPLYDSAVRKKTVEEGGGGGPGYRACKKIPVIRGDLRISLVKGKKLSRLSGMGGYYSYAVCKSGLRKLFRKF